MDKNELMSTITTAHRELAELMERISDDRLRDPAMGDWNGKDVLAHLAAWHDHSATVIDALRAGRKPYDETDPANSTDAVNERIHDEHAGDPPARTRVAFQQSFDRLLAALGPLSDDDLFRADRWQWLDGEALAEMLLWDTSRHYEAHVGHLELLARPAPRGPSAGEGLN